MGPDHGDRRCGRELHPAGGLPGLWAGGADRAGDRGGRRRSGAGVEGGAAGATAGAAAGGAPAGGGGDPDRPAVHRPAARSPGAGRPGDHRSRVQSRTGADSGWSAPSTRQTVGSSFLGTPSVSPKAPRLFRSPESLPWLPDPEAVEEERSVAPLVGIGTERTPPRRVTIRRGHTSGR